jgi:hypothetical protein
LLATCPTHVIVFDLVTLNTPNTTFHQNMFRSLKVKACGQKGTYNVVAHTSFKKE